jgi:tetratricopeptide (TPR) repeat protein/DNA-binding SARP family transcriptional activator
VGATFGILGRTSLRVDGELQERWGTPRLRGVLATLLIYVGRSVSVDTLIEWVWAEETAIPQNPLPTFYTHAARIRRELKSVDSPVALIVENGHCRLEAERDSIDYYHFRTLLADARTLLRSDQPRQAADLVLTGVDLWRGRPLDDLRTSRADDWRRRVLADEWVPANTVLLDALLRLREFDDVLARVADLQAEFPGVLAFVKARLTALHELARYDDATEYYLVHRRRFMAGSDDGAGEELRRFYDELTGARQPAGTPIRVSRDYVVPRQLPHRTADFVGRRALLGRLDTASTNGAGEVVPGVVVVDGMAGVGKTALVVHWAHRVRSRFPDGELYFDLAGYSGETRISVSSVVSHFLMALGAPLAGEPTRRSREHFLSRLLANRRLLVVLDNVRDTAHIKDLVPLLATCLVVVTSRQKLTTLSTLTGARRVGVEPMTDAEGIELLSRRLGARPNLAYEHKVRIARLCGGLPLVLTVFAEHVARWTDAQLTEFTDQLDQHQLLSHVGVDGDGSATARTFFLWSYQALADAERRLFRLLAVHPGPDVSVDAACACDGRTRAATTTTLGALVGAHLLSQPDAFDRFRFHDLLRAFAEQCAESDESIEDMRAARRRLLSFYLASATNADRVLYPARLRAPELPVEQGVIPMTFTDPVRARAWFDRERTNLTEAVRCAAEHGFPEHSWRLADTVGTYFDRCGHYESSRVVRELAVAATRIAGLREWEASTSVGLGMVHAILGDHEEARRCLTFALRFTEDEGNERGQASTIHQLGRLEMARDDPAAAIPLYERCLAIAQRLDDHEVLSWTHCRLGEALRLVGRHDQALVHLHQARWSAEKVGERSALARSLAEIGMTYRDQRQYEAAAAHCAEALGIAESVPDEPVVAEVCTALAEIATTRGEAGVATRYAQRAVTVCRQNHNVTDEARALDVLGDAYLANADAAQARAAWRSAAELYDRIGNLRRARLVQTKVDEH